MASEHEHQGGEKPRIVVDTDWKAQVEAEKERLRRQEQTKRPAASEAGKGEAAMGEEGPLPPASFPLLVTTLANQAIIALGQAPHPITGKREVHLDQARHFIDTLGVLEAKTQGNLTPDESAMIEGILHDLRMIFVSVQSRK
jgi:hypothetical protein